VFTARYGLIPYIKHITFLLLKVKILYIYNAIKMPGIITFAYLAVLRVILRLELTVEVDKLKYSQFTGGCRDGRLTASSVEVKATQRACTDQPEF
jgi:hypothetical protein